MTTIYGVSAGEYSNWRIIGLFSTEEKAEKFQVWAREIGEREVNDSIAEYTLDPCQVEQRKGFRPFIIDMQKDGTTTRAEEWEGFVNRPGMAVTDWGKGREIELHGIIYSDSLEHAIKIFNEHRARLIAENNWKAEPYNPYFR